MSSTNRSNARDLHKSDYYVTPLGPIYELFENLDFMEPNFKILDPCAGGDSENQMSYPTVIQDLYPKCTIKTLDIREDSLADEKTNEKCGINTEFYYPPGEQIQGSCGLFTEGFYKKEFDADFRIFLDRYALYTNFNYEI